MSIALSLPLILWSRSQRCEDAGGKCIGACEAVATFGKTELNARHKKGVLQSPSCLIVP
jgi:hypothetical protein